MRSAPMAALILVAAGCMSPPAPQSPSGPPPPPAPPPPESSTLQSGASDSVAAAAGSPGALYYYRFKQTDPGSDRFTFLDRDLSFYFRPAPDALHLQIENRQDRPVWIDWDRSTFLDPLGNLGKLAHASTRWPDRYRALPATQIPGLQRFGDYALPLDYLVDPGGSDEQLHRPLFPEDASAPQYMGRDFGVDLVLRVEDRPRTYSFRFRVASVTPR